MKKILLYSNAMLLLTSLHHIYGAVIYQTPERYHILFLSVPVLVFNLYLRSRGSGNTTTVKAVHAGVTVLVPIVLIGLFEGAYNHGLKNTLYFLGTPTETMLHMFPPPVYVMPNDFIFEFTGICQALLLMPLVYHAYVHWLLPKLTHNRIVK